MEIRKTPSGFTTIADAEEDFPQVLVIEKGHNAGCAKGADYDVRPL